jgi:hypothetical protein
MSVTLLRLGLGPDDVNGAILLTAPADGAEADSDGAGHGSDGAGGD